ncbi:Zinc transporter 11, partial [Bienertia sinuspersici]
MSHKTSNFLSLIIIIIIIIIIPCISAHTSQSTPDSSLPSDQNQPNLREKSLILVKIWCLIIIFLGTFIGEYPLFLKWNDAFLVLGTQFSGGVFLGTAIMHFLSDANETFEDLSDKEYPFAFMLACFGYLLTMLADCVIMYVYRKSNTQGNSHSNNGLEATATSLGDTILLITALCFHSVFEGIAIGVSETKSDAWKALWTISLHKIFAAIAMAIALLHMIPDRPFLSCASYAFAFAISSPIGVAIGIIIDQTTQGQVADWMFAISMSIACGVFVYVSVNHLLAKGYNPNSKVRVNTPFYRFLAVVFGIG